MPVEPRYFQPTGDVVSIAGWESDEDFPFLPQDKAALAAQVLNQVWVGALDPRMTMPA